LCKEKRERKEDATSNAKQICGAARLFRLESTQVLQLERKQLTAAVYPKQLDLDKILPKIISWSPKLKVIFN
jgi:hypothetical protein